MKIVRHPSCPAHLFYDDTAYFITASTWNHQKLLSDAGKSYLVDLMHDTYLQFGWRLDEWVVLDNHYHLLCHSQHGKDLPKIIAKIHSLSARMVKDEHPELEDRVWYNYWDYCPRDDKEYNTRLCYLLDNPRKHGYVKKLSDWSWSSFYKYVDDLDKMRDKFREYADYRELELG